MTYDYDVIIIGSGPAGFSCAMQSTKFNKKVLIVEASDESIGGSWISKGTIPSKALRAAAKSIQSFQSQFGDPKGRKPYDRFRMEDIMGLASFGITKLALERLNRLGCCPQGFAWNRSFADPGAADALVTGFND